VKEQVEEQADALLVDRQDQAYGRRDESIEGGRDSGSTRKARRKFAPARIAIA
jgi:hypothetical protein